MKLVDSIFRQALQLIASEKTNLGVLSPRGPSAGRSGVRLKIKRTLRPLEEHDGAWAMLERALSVMTHNTRAKARHPKSSRPGTMMICRPLLAAVLSTLSLLSSARAQDSNVCQTIARNLTPDIFLQGTSQQKFQEIKKFIGESQFEDWNTASHTKFDGTLLSEYVDIFVKDQSDVSSWRKHREQFLNIDSSVVATSDISDVRITKWNQGIVHQLVDCQKIIANMHGGTNFMLDKVSDNRDSFAIRLTYASDGGGAWSLTTLSANPFDPGFHCDNNFERASLQHPMKLTNHSMLIACTKSPRRSFLLSVGTTAGDARNAFSVESVDEEIKNLRVDTDAKVMALKEAVNKSGMVVSFASSSCPSPWIPYKPAEGRFIRGLDPSGKVDADGVRVPGSTQEDSLKAHLHTMGTNGTDTLAMAGGGGTQRLAHFGSTSDPSPNHFGGGGKKQTDNNEPQVSETRPKNVALLYCILP